MWVHHEPHLICVYFLHFSPGRKTYNPPKINPRMYYLGCQNRGPRVCYLQGVLFRRTFKLNRFFAHFWTFLDVGVPQICCKQPLLAKICCFWREFGDFPALFGFPLQGAAGRGILFEAGYLPPHLATGLDQWPPPGWCDLCYNVGFISMGIMVWIISRCLLLQCSLKLFV